MTTYYEVYSSYDCIWLFSGPSGIDIKALWKEFKAKNRFDDYNQFKRELINNHNLVQLNPTKVDLDRDTGDDWRSSMWGK